MTDPNVVALLELLAHRTFWNESSPARTEVIRLMGVIRANALLAAAPPVVPVKFNKEEEVSGLEWSATRIGQQGGMPPMLTVHIDLRPGEDAGEVAARMLAAVGRSA